MPIVAMFAVHSFSKENNKSKRKLIYFLFFFFFLQLFCVKYASLCTSDLTLLWIRLPYQIDCNFLNKPFHLRLILLGRGNFPVYLN